MTETTGRWVLAFDASCATCRTISAAVSSACEDRLAVLPLDHPDVRQWRQQALGERATWVPTLLRVEGGNVRAWTGTSMALPLSRRLGPRSGLRVLRALGDLRRRATHPLSADTSRHVGRAQFFRVAAGAAVAGGIVVTGRAPAFAEKTRSNAKKWVKAHAGQLPQRYDTLISYPVEYRREIWRASTPAVRSSWWAEQLRRYKRTRADLSRGQRAVIDDAIALVNRKSTFDFDHPGRDAVRRRADDLEQAVLKVFDREEAGLLFGTLGPADGAHSMAEPAGVVVPGCDCHVSGDVTISMCNPSNCVGYWINPCGAYSPGCGAFWLHECDGLCMS